MLVFHCSIYGTKGLQRVATRRVHAKYHFFSNYHDLHIIGETDFHDNIRLCFFYMFSSIQDMDDDAVIETVDFSEFEALFQVKRFKKTEKASKREESKTHKQQK